MTLYDEGVSVEIVYACPPSLLWSQSRILKISLTNFTTLSTYRSHKYCEDIIAESIGVLNFFSHRTV